VDYQQINDIANTVGVLALVFSAMIAGLRKKWAFYWVIEDRDKLYQDRIEDLEKRLESQGEDLAKMQDLAQEKFLPAIVEATHVIQDMLIEKRRG
jgi:hypothetical protein